MDLEALVTDELRDAEIAGYALEWFEVEASSQAPAARARVGAARRTASTAEGTFTGDGPIDAVFRAINAATGIDASCASSAIGAVTEGQDALGEVSVVVEVEGLRGVRAGRVDRHHRGRRARLRARAVGRRRSAPTPSTRRRACRSPLA